MHLPTLLFLVPLLSTAVVAQTAGTSGALIYTTGASVGTSLAAAVASGNAPAIAIQASSGTDTATGLVAPMPTTATVGPATIPQITGSVVYTSAPQGSGGEVKSTATRAPYTAIGTVNLSQGSLAATSTSKSAAGRLGVSGGVVMSVAMALGGVAVGAACL
ncbi:hypothetical protein RQP46_001766 [Phenoliferia psychrophenolica]